MGSARWLNQLSSTATMGLSTAIATTFLLLLMLWIAPGDQLYYNICTYERMYESGYVIRMVDKFTYTLQELLLVNVSSCLSLNG